MKQVVVVGGGASGLMAAITAAEQGAAVTILEADKKPAAKILRTGNGRCNFTNTGDMENRYHGTAPEFAEQVIRHFPPEKTIERFREMGILPYETDHWIYPHSETAVSVANALLKRVRELKIKLKCSERVINIERTASGFSIQTEGWHYDADRVILCCGSSASMKPDFYAGVSKLPVRLKEKAPYSALCALKTKKAAKEGWMGVRVHGSVTLTIDGKTIRTESGQIQFTKDGISGIAVFNAASRVVLALEEKKHCEILLDLVPDFTSSELLKYLEDRSRGNCENIRELLSGIIPEKLFDAVLHRMQDQEDLTHLVHVLKEFRTEIIGTADISASQVAGGGILTHQIDPDTMMVKNCPGLYIAGEMLDIDGECGGWNLQFAWSGGYLAGMHAPR